MVLECGFSVLLYKDSFCGTNKQNEQGNEVEGTCSLQVSVSLGWGGMRC